MPLKAKEFKSILFSPFSHVAPFLICGGSYSVLPFLLLPFPQSILQGQCASFLGEGDGTRLQYSWLESPMGGGAWWAAAHGVAKSRTWLSDFPFTFHFHALEKDMATHSSVLAWRIPGMGEPGGLPSLGSHRVGHDWSDLAAAAVAVLGSLIWSSLLGIPKSLSSLSVLCTHCRLQCLDTLLGI